MEINNLLCKALKLHTFDKEIFCNHLYIVYECKYCNSYKVLYKDYEIINKYTKNNLPKKIKNIINKSSLN